MQIISQIIQFLSENATIIDTTFGIFLGIATLLVALWIALWSPQAVQAKIARKDHIDGKRKEHYQRLKKEIFEPFRKEFVISYIKKETESNRLKITISNVFDNPLGNNAFKHLKKDYSSFKKEIFNIEKSVDEYNQQLDEYFKYLDREIAALFSQEYEISDREVNAQEKEVFFVKQIRHAIIDFFVTEFHNIDWDQKPEEICSICKSRLLQSSDEQNSTPLNPIRIRGFIVIYDGKTFPQFEPLSNPENLESFLDNMDERRDQISKIICKIISKQSTFSEYSRLDLLRANILETESDLKTDVKVICDLIDKGDYETIADCCKDKIFL